KRGQVEPRLLTAGIVRLDADGLCDARLVDRSRPGATGTEPDGDLDASLADDSAGTEPAASAPAVADASHDGDQHRVRADRDPGERDGAFFIAQRDRTVQRTLLRRVEDIQDAFTERVDDVDAHAGSPAASHWSRRPGAHDPRQPASGSDMAAGPASAAR